MQTSFKDKKPTLYIVSTPIGNLEDITYRAINILNEVSVVFAEDTRVSSKLFKHYGIKTNLISYYEERKYEKIDLVLDQLKAGLDVALISDAGTPGISDPGFELIEKVIENNFYVVSIPGATASIAALTSSGLKMQPHLFVGFLPRKESEIKSVLNEYRTVKATLIFYESPHRITKTLKSLLACLGNRKVVLARELTKMFETLDRTNLEEAINKEHNIKGEYVILVEGYVKEAIINPDINAYVDKYIKQGFSEKEAMRLTANELNISRRDVYQKIKVE